MDIQYITSLVADMACELEGKNRISSHSRQLKTQGMSAIEIAEQLSGETGHDLGPDLHAWSDWVLKNDKLDTMSEEGALMLCCRVLGRLYKKKEEEKKPN